jgi:hypothetical protein
MKDQPNEYTGFDKDIWPQIQFHNERVYENLKIFIQLTLAICGGLAYLTVNKVSGNIESVRSLIELAAWLQLSLGFYTSIAIMFHLHSQIRRYSDKTNLFKKSFSWLEPYMVFFIMGISILIARVAIFELGPRIVVSQL